MLNTKIPPLARSNGTHKASSIYCSTYCTSTPPSPTPRTSTNNTNNTNNTWHHQHKAWTNNTKHTQNIKTPPPQKIQRSSRTKILPSLEPTASRNNKQPPTCCSSFCHTRQVKDGSTFASTYQHSQ